MKKYLIFSLAIISSLFFLLQIPITFQQTAVAADKTVQCHCVNEGVTGMGSNHGKNNWVCDDSTGNGSCNHQEEYCQNTPGAQIGQATEGGTAGRGGGTPPTTVHFVGVSCQTTSICGCSGDGKQIQCYTPSKVNGQEVPNHYIANDQNSQAQAFDCGTGTSCEKKPGVNDSGFSYLARQVTGVACVSQCTCDGTNGKSGSHGSAGQGKNGWTCKDGSKGACGNLEDYCQNTPSGTSSVSCINSSTCTCKDANTVHCSAGAGVKNQQGQPDEQDFDCGSGRQCVKGNQYSHDFANQQVKGADCQPIVPPTLPPPPSPPCRQWSPNGRCDMFGSAFGGFSTDPSEFIQKVFAILLSVSGGIALLLIMRAGYSLMTAQGNPEKLNNAREQLVAAIVGLIFLIFSFVFLELIGYDILRVPGFQSTSATSPGGGTCPVGSCINAQLCQAKNGHCNPNGCPQGQACVQY